jgi:bifunctional DNA-binding transcriptional regulator/antitoxin component of YhaV-PrlF toxin-antitoxin module
MNAIARVTPDGRLDLPSEVLKAAGLEHGGSVTVAVVDGDIRISTIEQAVARAQSLSRKLLGDRSGSTVEDFLRRRREDMGE